jgi:hypothetical protein
MASAAMYIRSAVLYSKLPNITVERRPQKSTFSSGRLWVRDCENFEKKKMYDYSKVLYL